MELLRGLKFLERYIMYELCNIKGDTYYINCPAKIGLYVMNGEAYLIDSGNDKDAGKKVKRILDENKWSLKAILNTHSHADHIGGNKYLQTQTGCKIYAKGIEKAFTDSPILEPSFLNGSYPSGDLLHKFIFAQESKCDDISECDLPDGFEVIDLPGHSFEMIGIRTPDNVLFASDCVSSPVTLQKYGISYIFDVCKYLSTLDYVEKLSADAFVPSHSDICKNMAEICEINRQSVLSISKKIKSFLGTPNTFENLNSFLFDEYNLTMTNEQYVLIGSTVKSYLSYLKDSGAVVSYFENNKMYWKA